VAYKIRQSVDGIAFVAIGTVPFGTRCIAENPVGDYYRVPRAAVTLASRFDTLPLIVIGAMQGLSARLEALLGVITNYIIEPILTKVETMSQQIDNLTAAVTALTATVAASIANEYALKSKLDAAIAGNVALQAQLEAAQAAHATAQASALNPAESAALDSAVTTIGQASQQLADATAMSSPTN
jgi:hypothetical protein